MSVIFKTLKKLKNPSFEENGKGMRRKGRGVYSFRGMLLSPSAVLFIALFIFLAGFGAIYGAGRLRDYIAEKSHGSALSEKRTEDDRKAEVKKDSIELPAGKETPPAESKDIPASPDIIPGEETGPERVSLPPRELPTVRSDSKNPTTGPSKLLPEPKMPGMAVGQSEAVFISKQDSLGLDGDDTPSAKGAFLPKVSAGSDTDETMDSPSDSSSRVNMVRTENRGGKFSERKHEFTSKERSIPGAVEALPDKSAEEMESNKSKDEKVHIANVEKSSRAIALVSKIERSMIQADDKKTADLFDELAALKGEENSYVLKLNAYWYLRKNEYESAAMILKRVLDRDQKDLEAGINMAIIEIKRGQLQAARNRLARLREFYPENTQISEILLKLRK